MKTYLKWGAKALYAAAVAGVATATLAIDSGITPKEWLVIAGAVLAAGGGVFKITNGADPR